MKRFGLSGWLVLFSASVCQGAVITLRPTINASVQQISSPIFNPPSVQVTTNIQTDTATLGSGYTAGVGGIPNPSAQSVNSRRIELVFDLTTLPAGTIAQATLFWSEATDDVTNRGGTLNRHQLEGYLGEDLDLPFFDTPNQDFPIITSQVANGSLNSLIQHDVTSILSGIMPGEVSAKFVITPESPYTVTTFGIRTSKVDPYSIHSRLAAPGLQPGLAIEVVPEAPAAAMIVIAGLLGLWIQWVIKKT